MSKRSPRCLNHPIVLCHQHTQFWLQIHFFGDQTQFTMADETSRKFAGRKGLKHALLWSAEQMNWLRIMECNVTLAWPRSEAVWVLTHWGRVTHICVSNLNIIVPDNGLSPGRRQAIIWTNAGILLIGSLGTNFSEILIENHTFSFKKMLLKMSSGKWRPFCLGLNVLTHLISPASLSLENWLFWPTKRKWASILIPKPPGALLLTGINWDYAMDK